MDTTSKDNPSYEVTELSVSYRIEDTVKIPKISPGAYIFQRLFVRGLSTEGNLRFKIDWASPIVGIFYFKFEGNFQVQVLGGLILIGL